jgi:hypothetical protein
MTLQALSYLASLYRPLEAVAYSTSSVQGAAGSAWRVIEILRSDPEVKGRRFGRACVRR